MPYQILMIDDDREMVTLGKLILERKVWRSSIEMTIALHWYYLIS
jgi:hypothetical protein